MVPASSSKSVTEHHYANLPNSDSSETWNIEHLNLNKQVDFRKQRPEVLKAKSGNLINCLLALFGSKLFTPVFCFYIF